MTRSLRLATVVLGSLALAASAAAQGGPPAGARPGVAYDPKTVETVAGAVVRVERPPSRGRAGAQGVHLVLQPDGGGEPVLVVLGPSWYVDKQGMSLAPHDHVEVHGSRVPVDGKPAIVAAEVRKGGSTLVLRDANGVPAWGGGGRRRGR